MINQAFQPLFEADYLKDSCYFTSLYVLSLKINQLSMHRKFEKNLLWFCQHSQPRTSLFKYNIIVPKMKCNHGQVSLLNMGGGFG